MWCLWWQCKVFTQLHKKAAGLCSLFTLGYPTYILCVMWLREGIVSEQKKICRLLCFVCESLNSVRFLKGNIYATAFACNTCTEIPAVYLQHPMWCGSKMQQNKSSARYQFYKNTYTNSCSCMSPGKWVPLPLFAWWRNMFRENTAETAVTTL